VRRFLSAVSRTISLTVFIEQYPVKDFRFDGKRARRIGFDLFAQGAVAFEMPFNVFFRKLVRGLDAPIRVLYDFVQVREAQQRSHLVDGQAKDLRFFEGLLPLEPIDRKNVFVFHYSAKEE
jgi:reverse gyrase